MSVIVLPVKMFLSRSKLKLSNVVKVSSMSIVKKKGGLNSRKNFNLSEIKWIGFGKAYLVQVTSFQF